MSFDDIKAIFNYLDNDQDGLINQNEFRLLSEENWRKLDPMKRYMDNLIMGSKKDTTQSISSAKSRKSELKEMDFRSLEKLANRKKALNFAERPLNEDTTTMSSKQLRSTQTSFYKMKPNQIDPFTIYGAGNKKSIKEMCHGKSWIRDSNMTDVIEGKFLRNSIEERILRREDSSEG